ncbi:MAG: DinB family protein [Flavobacteriales bacterium]
MKELIAYNTTVLRKIDGILHQLTNEELSRPFALLFGSSIGQHMRHILEFYECLLVNMEDPIFSYDRRQRNPLIGSEVVAARACAVRSISLLKEITGDRTLRMESELPAPSPWSVQETTLKRELAYLADHGVHHLAMIRIALGQHLPHVAVPEDLGVAASTRNHQAR